MMRCLRPSPPDGDERRPPVPLDPQQGHQREDAALAVIVDAHGDRDVVANFDKVLEGGYVPLLLATCVYAIMVIWHRGSVAVMQAFKER